MQFNWLCEAAFSAKSAPRIRSDIDNKSENEQEPLKPHNPTGCDEHIEQGRVRQEYDAKNRQQNCVKRTIHQICEEPNKYQCQSGGCSCKNGKKTCAHENTFSLRCSIYIWLRFMVLYDPSLTKVWTLIEFFFLPRPAFLDVHKQRPAQECPNQYQQPKNADALPRSLQRDCFDNVRCDQDFQTKEKRISYGRAILTVKVAGGIFDAVLEVSDRGHGDTEHNDGHCENLKDYCRGFNPHDGIINTFHI